MPSTHTPIWCPKCKPAGESGGVGVARAQCGRGSCAHAALRRGRTYMVQAGPRNQSGWRTEEHGRQSWCEPAEGRAVVAGSGEAHTDHIAAGCGYDRPPNIPVWRTPAHEDGVTPAQRLVVVECVPTQAHEPPLCPVRAARACCVPASRACGTGARAFACTCLVVPAPLEPVPFAWTHLQPCAW